MFSYKSSLFYFRFGIFSIAVWYLIDNNNKIYQNLFKSLFITYCILLIDAFFQYFTGKNLLGYEIAPTGRLSGLFGEEMILGSYLTRLFPFLVSLFLIKKDVSKKFLILFLFLILGIDLIVFLSGERVAIFLLTLSTILIILFIKKFKVFRIITFASSIILITIITLQSEKIKKRIVTTTIDNFTYEKMENSQNNKSDTNKVNKNETSIKINFFSTEHQILFLTSIKMLKDNYFFGQGPKMFRLLCKKFYDKGNFPDNLAGGAYCNNHPHNIFLQLLAETGLIGFSFVLIIFLYVSYLLIIQFFNPFFKKKVIISDYKICILIGFFINLWPLIPSGNFFNNWLSIVYFLPIGFYLKAINEKNI